jgi:hypothetical protein
MPDDNGPDLREDQHAAALTRVLEILKKLDPEGVWRVIETVATYFKTGHALPTRAPAGVLPLPSFSEDRSLSPKQFLLEKAPQTDVEKVACLAFYLTHYRDMRYFKTLDISKLNTEAAQIKFSNATAAVNNATGRDHYLAPAGKGAKQISAFGEKFVQALPDREAAKTVMAQARQKRRPRRPARSNNHSANGNV